MTLITKTPEETIALGKRLGSMLKKGDVVALQGTLAAGKTTITKGIALALGITEPVTSPTFTLISEYYGSMTLYHMDVYRLDSTEDFLNLGVEELLYGDGVCVVEWSEKVMKELPKSAILVRLAALDDGSREITIDNWKYGELSA
ncbi:MAG TPA: tRNA (adenosine(37)-N6)-threonylcarbamoyltransferase complex ATPase subunit type 1 TsaE [Treponemataceae bacterium]|nr:tRNA (adenosine(37)-N6)-threonylcarbamoyltransferase complex ATPase subunit type 1 TsaE [Treponemataceae bacterium]